ncbi:hypothetical protein SDC9_07880 [bioreactor metagenome]|uniref:Uncharacterized protein n=1 Tax=bioreactor metagenome TaxID=1076179 RepID=A0A644T664_9ZZZZ
MNVKITVKQKRIFFLSFSIFAMSVFYLLIANFLLYLNFAASHNGYPFSADCIFFEVEVTLSSISGMLLTTLKLAMIVFWFFMFFISLKEYKKLEYF